MSDFRSVPHWTRDSDGEWAVCVPGKKVKSGAHIVVSKADGSYQSVVVTGYIEEGSHGSLYTVDTQESDRMSRASETLFINLDSTAKKANFIGSGGKLYNTTLHSCTCPDFKKRKAACKHMYRLAHELSISDHQLLNETANGKDAIPEFEVAPKKHWVHMLSLDASIFCLVFGALFFIEFTDGISIAAPWFIGFIVLLCVSGATKIKTLKTSKLSVFTAFVSAIFLYLGVIGDGSIVVFIVCAIFLVPTLVFAFIIEKPPVGDSVDESTDAQDISDNEDSEKLILNTVYGGEHENKKVKVVDGVAHIVLSKDSTIPLTSSVVDTCIVVTDGINFNVTTSFINEDMSFLMVDKYVYEALKMHCQVETEAEGDVI